MTEGRDEYENALRARRAAVLRGSRTSTNVLVAALLTLALVVSAVLISRIAAGPSRFSPLLLAIVAFLWIAVAARWAVDRRKSDADLLRRRSPSENRNARFEAWTRRHWRWAVPSASTLALAAWGASIMTGGAGMYFTWIAILVFSVACAVASQTAWLGWRGWSTGDEEHCKQCGYPAPTGEELPICPECGQVLVKGVTTVTGRRERSPAMAATGASACALLLIAAFLPGIAGARAALASAMPTGTLIASSGAAQWQVRSVLFTELFSRTLTAAEADRLAELILREAEDRAASWRVPKGGAEWLGASLGKDALGAKAADHAVALLLSSDQDRLLTRHGIRSGLSSAPPTREGLLRIADAALAACSSDVFEHRALFEWIGRWSATFDLPAEWYDKAAERFISGAGGRNAAEGWVAGFPVAASTPESRGKSAALAARVVGATNRMSFFGVRHFLADCVVRGDAADEIAAVAVADQTTWFRLLDAIAAGGRPAKPYPPLVRRLLEENERDRPGLGWSWLQGLRDGGELSPEDAERFDRIDWRFRRMRGAPLP